MGNSKPVQWKPVWEDPPEAHATRMLWHDRLAALVERPGEWAKIALHPDDEKAHQLRSSLHRRRYNIPQPEDEWEFITRKGAVYARYIGPTQSN